MMGDSLSYGSCFGKTEGETREALPTLSPDYISVFAKWHDLTPVKRTAILIMNPILQVMSQPVTTQQQSKHTKKSNSLLLTHMHHFNARSKVMMARLSIHFAHDGHKLGAGDIS